MPRRAATAPSDTATRKLAEVRAEIHELTQPLPNQSADVDVDELTATLTSRTSRARALELVIPALERQVLAERRLDIDARFQIENEALTRAAGRADEARTRRDTAVEEFEVANGAWMDADRRVNAVLGEGYKLDDDLRAHEDRHGTAFAVTPAGSN